MVTALAARPSVDREVHKRAVEMVSDGATRFNGVRRKQDANSHWSRPFNWTSLAPSEDVLTFSEGVLTFVELPDESHRVAKELLPPKDDISAYVLDPAVERKMKATLDDAKLRQWYIEQIRKC